ncbi:MAG TPA: tripartite tricarboxylate transporter TctB family protein [Dongiaceae bacterium]|nr:tripartite tricarboxylate transporter TctB family protein [Dongiaceae bacterium]
MQQQTGGTPEYVNTRSRDCYGGILMLAVGAAAAVEGVHYGVGTLTEMGPGFFPTTVGVGLAIVGAAMALVALIGPAQSGARRLPPEWKAWSCILAGIAAFVVLGRWGGLIPATFAIVFISAFADRETRIRDAVLLAAGMTVVSVIVFWWALQMQFPLFTWG